VTRCGAVTPREAGESRPVVTVLVTQLPHRSKQELHGHSSHSLSRAMDPTRPVVAVHVTIDDTA
jgi:hypothetical protein